MWYRVRKIEPKEVEFHFIQKHIVKCFEVGKSTYWIAYNDDYTILKVKNTREELEEFLRKLIIE